MNRTKKAEYQKRYRERHKEEIKASRKKYYAAHKARMLEQDRQYYQKHKEDCREQQREYKENNKERFSYRSSKRRAMLRKAVPSWHESEKDLIIKLYKKRDELSELLGVELHVDHVIPINGNGVCGLHSWANLQLLDGTENMSKHCRYQKDW